MNRPLFPKTLSIPSYDFGNEVALRTYQHPLVYLEVHEVEESKECFEIKMVA